MPALYMIRVLSGFLVLRRIGHFDHAVCARRAQIPAIYYLDVEVKWFCTSSYSTWRRANSRPASGEQF